MMIIFYHFDHLIEQMSKPWFQTCFSGGKITSKRLIFIKKTPIIYVWIFTSDKLNT